MRFVPAALLLLLIVPTAFGAPAPGPDPTDDPVHAAAWLARHPGAIDAVPDFNGPGSCVSTAGNVWIKTINIGLFGNPFTANSADPSGQWPGPSGVQYMGFWNLWLAAKNPEAADPTAVRRVDHGIFEWRPPSLAPEDRIYSAFEGQANGVRDFDDDGDGKVDEEFLNGKDDDGDGKIDEDFAAVSQQMCTLELRDDTEQSINQPTAEKHVPFGVYVRETTYAFAVPGANDFVGKSYEIYNQSGHQLDSVFVGFFVDFDIGPSSEDRFFADDLAEPRIPQGDYVEDVPSTDPRFDASLCTQDTIHVNGFTYIDDDGDMGKTTGAGSFLLLNHTTDPTGIKAPRRVGFRMYRTYSPGTPFQQGGQPIIDLERYQTMASTFGIDPVTGFIDEERSETATKTDFRSICSVGPFLQWENNEKLEVEVALAVQRCDYSRPLDNLQGPGADPQRYAAIVRNAIETQKTYRGGPVPPRSDEPTPDMIGRETALIAAPGTDYELADCRDPEGTTRTVNDREYTWFDLDCNYCTGTVGFSQRRWLAAAPPPSPRLRVTPADQQVTLEWDNRSEYSPDPSSGLLDFNAYRIWKASNFTRPVGSAGPGDELWSLLAELHLHDEQRPLIDSVDTNQDGLKDAITKTFPVLLNTQSQERIFPEDVPPLFDPVTGDTLITVGDRPYLDDHGAPQIAHGVRVPHYPIGRYRYVDHNVLNGFIYFYSVVGKDSTGQRGVHGERGTLAEQEGRRGAVEGDGVVPQGAQGTSAKQVYVVPNPYRGRAQWDLSPNAADPTGTHVDFFNMPAGRWTLRIFTLAGDLVQTLRNTDLLVSGKPQQETPTDGQATWNLISRNGQDVSSGIYLFSVESDLGSSQGRFVLIR